MIITSTLKEINLLPNTLEEEISQNIHTILNTIKGTVALNRNFGIDIGFLDNVSDKGLIKCKMAILNAISTYEPRVKVIKVNVKKDVVNAQNGDFYIEVEVNILDEYK